MRKRMKTSVYTILLICFIGCSRTVDNKSIYYALQSDTLLNSGDLKGAELAIKKAIEIDNKNYIAYNNLGVLNIKLGLPEDKVLEAFFKSASLNIHYPTAIHNIANYYFEIKKYALSVEYCNKYIELIESEEISDEYIANIYAIRGECYNYLEQYSKAKIDLDYAISLNPNDTGAYKELGWAYRNLYMYNEAIKNYTKAIRMNPNYAQAYNGLGIVYDIGLKDFNKALENYNKAIELDSNSGTYLYNRGSMLYDNGFIEKAYPDLKKSVSLGKVEAKEYLRKYNNK